MIEFERLFTQNPGLKKIFSNVIYMIFFSVPEFMRFFLVFSFKNDLFSNYVILNKTEM